MAIKCRNKRQLLAIEVGQQCADFSKLFSKTIFKKLFSKYYFIFHFQNSFQKYFVELFSKVFSFLFCPSLPQGLFILHVHVFCRRRLLQ